MHYEKLDYGIAVSGVNSTLQAARDALRDAVMSFVSANPGYACSSCHPNKFGFLQRDEVVRKRGTVLTGLKKTAGRFIDDVVFGVRTNRLEHPFRKLGSTFSELRQPVDHYTGFHVSGKQRDDAGKLLDPSETPAYGLVVDLAENMSFTLEDGPLDLSKMSADEILRRFPEIRQIAEQFERNLAETASGAVVQH